MIGLILGERYEIIEEVGKGGMAHVYKAHCKLLNRMVAVKVLRNDLDSDTDFLKRFNVEAQAAASLVHPNIVSIFDFGFDQGYHYIVMEYIDGITLKQYINENAPLDCKEALGIAYQICDALSAAHDNNIVHRDIKPHNILITADHRVKVTDFGIARAATGSTMTADSDILGSVHYMSPEQVKGSIVDGKSDLYSLGIVVYEMLTGRLPFDSDAPVAIAMKHISEEPVSPRDYNPDLSYSLESMMLKAVAKDKSMRYQNAHDMMKDISRLIDNPDAVIESEPTDEGDSIDSTRIIKRPEGIESDAVIDTNSENKNDNDSTENKKDSKPNTKKDDGKKIPKKDKTFIVISAFLTAFVIVGALSLGLTNFLFPDALNFAKRASEKAVVVPDFVNKTLDEVSRIAKEHNIIYEVREEVQDDSKKEGTVLKQVPVKGSTLPPGEVVYLTVCVGTEEVEVNDVVGTKLSEAEVALTKAGFHVITELEHDDTMPKDVVVMQFPEGGEKASHGSTVRLTVSLGPEKLEVPVPDVRGVNLEDAKSKLEEAGLSLGKISYEKSVVNSGIVTRQSILPEDTDGKKNSVPEGTAIDIVISNGGNDEIDAPSATVTPTDKTLKYKLNSNKEEVRVTVEDNGKIIYEVTHRPAENPNVSIKVSGTGKKSYDIFVDGAFETSVVIDFSE